MAKVGGDLVDVRFNHPTIGSGVIFVKSDEDSELDLGGLRTNDDEKSVDSGGNNIKVMTRSRWSASFVAATDLTTEDDLKKFTDLAGSSVDAQWTISHISGAVYRATGGVVGDVKAAMKAATIQLKIAGGSIAKLV